MFLFYFLLYAHHALAKKLEVQDFQMRELIPLRIINLHGPIELKGWALDKIRVEIQMDDESPVSTHSRKPRIRFEKVGQVYELALDFDFGLPLEQKLKARQLAAPVSKFKIWAPAQLSVELLGARFAAQVEDWVGPISASQIAGTLLFRRMRVGARSDYFVQAVCDACDIRVEDSEADIRLVTVEGAIHLWNVRGKNLYSESRKGSIRAVRVRGRQTFVTQSGSLFGQDLHGPIQIHSDSGKIQILDASGEMSGRCRTCNWTAKFRSWTQKDPAILENSEGNLQLELPVDFSSTLHLVPVSQNQETPASSLGFQLLQWPKAASLDPQRPGALFLQGPAGSPVLKVVGIPSRVSISPYLGR